MSSVFNSLVTSDDVERFQRDGAILIRQALSPEWMSVVAEGIEDIYSNRGGMTSVFTNEAGTSETVTDQFPSRRNDKFRKLVDESPLASLAGRLMGGRYASYFFDQVFYKRAGLISPTPYHQDTPYLRVEGNDLARTWVCCDPSPKQTTVGVVRGSHRWNVVYRTATAASIEKDSGGDFSYQAEPFETQLPPLPDVERYRDSFDILEWDVSPGDVLVFNGNVLHGATGNFEMTHSRRAVAVLWAGDDARYKRRPGHTIPDMGELIGATIEEGELIVSRPDIYPTHWQAG